MSANDDGGGSPTRNSGGGSPKRSSQELDESYPAMGQSSRNKFIFFAKIEKVNKTIKIESKFIIFCQISPKILFFLGRPNGR